MRKKSECGFRDKDGQGFFFGMGKKFKITKKILTTILKLDSIPVNIKENIAKKPENYRLELLSKSHINTSFLQKGDGCIICLDPSNDGEIARNTKQEINGSNGWLHVNDL